MELSKFFLKDTTMPIQNEKIEFETSKWTFFEPIESFNLTDSDEMAWQINDLLVKNFWERDSNMAKLKVMTFDFIKKYKILISWTDRA